MQPFRLPPIPPRFMPHPPPPCPPGNPFPTLDTEPTAKKSELNAEIARAMAAESGIVESAVTAATESVTAAVSGLAETSAAAIEEMRASVTAAVSGANAAAARAERVVQDATLRDRVSGIASAAAATAVGNLFSSGGLADQVASRAVSGVVDSAVEALQSTYATKGEIRAKANKSYVDACLKQAVLMTQSPDGLSQIQIGNDGVPKVIIKTITATHENQGTVSWHGTTWTFGWTPDDIDELNAAVWEEVSSTSYPWYNSLGTNGELAEGDELFVGTPPSGSASLAAEHHYHIVLVKKASDGTRNLWVLMEPQGGGNTHWTWGLASSLNPTLNPAPEESSIDTMYLVTEETLGSLEARIAALEAAQ